MLQHEEATFTEVPKLESDPEHGIYFWRSCGLQLGSHRTRFTPKWCAVCRFAFETDCVCSLKENTMSEAAAEKAESTVKIEKFTRSLRIALSEPDLQQRGNRVAHLIAQREQKESDRKAANTAAKSQIEEVDAELKRMAGEIRDKARFDTVNCERRYIFRTGRVVEVRTDTGEEIYERPMTLDERQTELDLPDPDDEDDDEAPESGETEAENQTELEVNGEPVGKEKKPSKRKPARKS